MDPKEIERHRQDIREWLDAVNQEQMRLIEMNYLLHRIEEGQRDA